MNLRCIFCQALAAALAMWFTFAHADVGTKSTPRVVLNVDENRTVEMVGEVNRVSAAIWAGEIQRLDSQRKPFLIRISSPGGEIMPGLEVIKAIQNAKSPVVCVVDKYAASMAAFIFMACPTRAMHKLSILMFHEYATSIEGSRKQVKSQLALSEAMFDALMDELSRDSGIPRAELNQLVANDWWLNAKQADQYHLIAAIVDHYNVTAEKRQVDKWIEEAKRLFTPTKPEVF